MITEFRNLIYVLNRLGFPGGSEVKASASNVGDLGSIPGLGRSPGEGKGYLLQYSGLENSSFSILSFFLFILFMGFSRQE